jgi:iron complex outermembrane receptor protein
MTALRAWLLLCLVWGTLVAPARGAEPAATLAADIAPRPVAEALAAFGRQTGLQLIYVASIADAQQSKGARAGLSLSEALTQLLDDTGLRFEFLNPHTVRIYAPPPIRQTVSQVAGASERQTSRHGAAPLLALEEVIVTATRREESADKVPISMAVWTQEAMETSGIKSMTEIGALTPGVEFDFDSIAGSADYTNLVIRGVTGRHGTTTGVYIDDSPVPAARGDTFARSFPWVFDLDRVEVLRGPQSTLLGQGTLGGAVRFIMNQPSLTGVSGLARAEYSTTAQGDPSYEAGAAVGGPLITDVLGFRASAWYRSDGGFVDRIDPFTGATIDGNANRLLSKSARVALTWAPTGALRITPSLDYESFGIRDTPVFYVNLSSPAAGELRNGMLTQQPYDDSFYLAAVQLSEGFDGADLSAVSSYFHRTAAVTIDWGPDYPASYADAATLPVDFRQRMFSQEIRLTSADPNAVLTWIAGAFYSAEHKREASRIVPAMGAVENADATVTDHAQLEGFGQIGLRMTKRLVTTAGLRIGRTSYGAVTEAPPMIRADAAETWVAPRYGLSYQAHEHNLLYLTVAKGYRGGVVYPATPCGGPDAAPSDSVWSYEIGAKDDLLGGRVHIEPSVFHIEWNNNQPDALFLGNCASPGVPRSAAASNGFDLAVQALVTERVKAGLAVAYTDAHYTETLRVGDTVIVHKGDALGTPPGVPSPWSVTASIEYKVRLASGVSASLWAEENFHSHNPGPFISDNPASPFYAPGWRADPSTSVLNLRAGASWPSLDLKLFVNNALDAQPFLGFRAKSPPGSLFVARTFRPRTVGLSATRRF